MKTINVKVVPGAKNNEVIEENGRFKIRIIAPAVDGRANKELINALSDYFGVKKKNIRIIRGEWSRQKVIEIDTGS